MRFHYHPRGQSTTRRGRHTTETTDSRVRRPRALVSFGRILLAVVLLTAVSSLRPGKAAEPPHRGGIGPVADWIDDVIEVLEEVEEELSKSDQEVAGASGPLDEPKRSLVAGYLDNAASRIDQLLSPNSYPSLTPSAAGSVDVNVNPSSLAEYAADTLACAQEALIEALTSGDDEVIGSKMKTIQTLLPAYRALAGIE
jgi:hypothetical protein